ncbi:MAG: RecX family transcriptional regulator [bacterium]|nr:RecX family transcriptional regulator [bacterium]
MKITKIEKQAKRDRYNIYLDGVYGFSVASRVLMDCSLKEYQSLTDKQIEEIKNSDAEYKAYNRAILILSYRANTETELRKKLLKNFDEQNINKVIVKLKNQGFINDADFAERYIAQSKKGKRMTSLELLKKGVDKETINSLISEREDETEFKNALNTAEKVIKKHGDKDLQFKKQKLYENLVRRGFAYDVIKLVIKEILER